MTVVWSGIYERNGGMVLGMKQLFLSCLFISGLISVSPVLAESGQGCALIENAQKRLACFDRQFPRPEETPGSLNPDSETSGKSATPAADSHPEPVSDHADPVGAVEDLSSPAPPRRGRLFGWLETLDMDSEIAAVRRGAQQRMVFRLTNGQIWMQSTPRELPFSTGDKVKIKSGRVGGYIMRSESGTSTRVRRIE